MVPEIILCFLCLLWLVFFAARSTPTTDPGPTLSAAGIMIRFIRDVLQFSVTISEDSLNNNIHSFVHVNAFVFTFIIDSLAVLLAKKFSDS